MFQSAPLVSVKLAMMLMIFGGTMEGAPTERGFGKPPHHLPSLTHASKGVNPRQYLKHWLLSTAGVGGTTRTTDRTATNTVTASIRDGRWRTDSGIAGPDRRAQMLQMIAALEELQRTFNSTLSSRITIIPRANSRNSGRKTKVLPPAEGGVKPTTVAPGAVNSTASRSADVIVHSLTVRNFRKSVPPQTKKTNKRVCFWKYCSQN